MLTETERKINRRKSAKKWRDKNGPRILRVNKEWKRNNPDKVKLQSRRARLKRKRICIEYYGRNGCVCCGEKELSFLSLDHIRDNGAQDRRNNSKRVGNGLYLRLIQENFPSGFQVLCYNCQWGKRIGEGFCLHHPRTNLRKAR
jgi:hypothetical protein